jgi:hypothetical protein
MNARRAIVACMFAFAAACASFSSGDAPDAGTGDAAPEADAGSESGMIDGADGDAAVDAAPDGPPPCDGDAGCERVVFVSSLTFAPGLGIDAGDDLCNELARAAGVAPRVAGRTFVAWLSANGQPASSRHVHATAPYILVDETRVAAHWPALTSGTLEHAIDLDEQADAALPSVFTGTTPNGSTGGNTCGSWTAADATSAGITGSTSAKSGVWTEYSAATCNVARAIYCIEK